MGLQNGSRFLDSSLVGQFRNGRAVAGNTDALCRNATALGPHQTTQQRTSRHRPLLPIGTLAPDFAAHPRTTHASRVATRQPRHGNDGTGEHYGGRAAYHEQRAMHPARHQIFRLDCIGLGRTAADEDIGRPHR